MAVSSGAPHGETTHLFVSPDSPTVVSQWAVMSVDLSDQAGEEDVFLECWSRDDRITGRRTGLCGNQ